MRCAHCGQKLAYLRWSKFHFDGGRWCKVCGNVSYVSDRESLNRRILPNFLGLLPLIFINALLNPSMGYWSILVGVAVSAPILYILHFIAFRQTQTVASLPKSVLERRVNVAKLVLAVFAILIPLALLLLSGVGNQLLIALAMLGTVFVMGIAGWAALFKNIRESR